MGVAHLNLPSHTFSRVEAQLQRSGVSGKNSFAAEARSATDRYSQTVPKSLGAVSITLWPLSERPFPSAASTE